MCSVFGYYNYKEDIETLKSSSLLMKHRGPDSSDYYIDKKLFLPFLYPSVSFLFLLSLYNDFGMMAFLWLLVLVAGSDIGAYAIGVSLTILSKTFFASFILSNFIMVFSSIAQKLLALS